MSYGPFFVLALANGVINILCIFQIAYRIARDQFPERLRETFLVLSDDEPQPEPRLEARRLSLDPPRDPRGGRGGHSRKRDQRDQDSMSVDSASNAKKPDQSRSVEKRK